MSGHVSAAPETRGRPSIFLHEPAPVGSLTRLACYPWLVVGTTCLGAFAGQVDAASCNSHCQRLSMRSMRVLYPSLDDETRRIPKLTSIGSERPRPLGLDRFRSTRLGI